MMCCFDERFWQNILIWSSRGKYLSLCHRFEILLVRKLLTIFVILYSFA